MSTLTLVLMVAACVLFILAGIGVASGRFALGWLGAALVTLALIIPQV